MSKDLPWDTEDLYWLLNWIRREQKVRGLVEIRIILSGAKLSPPELVREIRAVVVAPIVNDPGIF